MQAEWEAEGGVFCDQVQTSALNVWKHQITKAEIPSCPHHIQDKNATFPAGLKEVAQETRSILHPSQQGDMAMGLSQKPACTSAETRQPSAESSHLSHRKRGDGRFRLQWLGHQSTVFVLAELRRAFSQALHAFPSFFVVVVFVFVSFILLLLSGLPAQAAFPFPTGRGLPQFLYHTSPHKPMGKSICHFPAGLAEPLLCIIGSNCVTCPPLTQSLLLGKCALLIG